MDFDHFWNELHVEDNIDTLYSQAVEKCSEMKTLIGGFQKYAEMQRNRIVEERTLFEQKCAALDAANAEKSATEDSEIDALVNKLLITDGIIEATDLFSTLKAKVFNDLDGNEDDDTKQLTERLQLRLERERRQRLKHMTECTSRMQDLLDQKTATLTEYGPLLNELLEASQDKFKAMLKESYDTERLAAAKAIQQFIRSQQTAAHNKHEELLRTKAQLKNEQSEQYDLLKGLLDNAKKTELRRPDEMRAEVNELDKQLEEMTLECDELRDTVLKTKENLQLQAEIAQKHQLLQFQRDAEVLLRITKLTAQRDKLQKKYDQLLEQITFRRNNYRR